MITIEKLKNRDLAQPSPYAEKDFMGTLADNAYWNKFKQHRHESNTGRWELSPEEQLELVEQDAWNITRLLFPTEDAMVAAVKLDPTTMHQWHHTCDSKGKTITGQATHRVEMVHAALQPYSINDNSHEDIKLHAIMANPKAITKLTTPTDEMKLIAKYGNELRVVGSFLQDVQFPWIDRSNEVVNVEIVLSSEGNMIDRLLECVANKFDFELTPGSRWQRHTIERLNIRDQYILDNYGEDGLRKAYSYAEDGKSLLMLKWTQAEVVAFYNAIELLAPTIDNSEVSQNATSKFLTHGNRQHPENPTLQCNIAGSIHIDAEATAACLKNRTSKFRVTSSQIEREKDNYELSNPRKVGASQIFKVTLVY